MPDDKINKLVSALKGEVKPNSNNNKTTVNWKDYLPKEEKTTSTNTLTEQPQQTDAQSSKLQNTLVQSNVPEPKTTSFVQEGLGEYEGKDNYVFEPTVEGSKFTTEDFVSGAWAPGNVDPLIDKKGAENDRKVRAKEPVKLDPRSPELQNTPLPEPSFEGELQIKLDDIARQKEQLNESLNKNILNEIYAPNVNPDVDKLSKLNDAEELLKKAKDLNDFIRNRPAESPEYKKEMGDYYSGAGALLEGSLIGDIAKLGKGAVNNAPQFWYDIKKGFTSPLAKDFFTVGLNELKRNFDVLDIAKRSNADPTSITAEEQKVLSAYNELTMLQNSNEMPFSYQLGQGVVEMIPYMAQFAATGGVGAGVEGAVSSYLTKKLGTNLIKNSVLRGTANAATKATGRIIGAIAQNALLPQSPNSFVEREMRNYEIGQSPEGQTAAKMIEDPTSSLSNFIKSQVEGIVSTAIENGSISEGLFRKLANKQSLGKLSTFAKKLEKAVGWNNPGFEFIEEFETSVFTNFINGDQEWSEIFNPKTQGVTFMTVMLTGGAFKAANLIEKGVTSSQLAQPMNKSKDDIISKGSFGKGVVSAMQMNTIKDRLNGLSNLDWKNQDEQTVASALTYVRNKTQYDVFKGFERENKHQQNISDVQQHIEFISNPKTGTVDVLFDEKGGMFYIKDIDETTSTAVVINPETGQLEQKKLEQSKYQIQNVSKSEMADNMFNQIYTQFEAENQATDLAENENIANEIISSTEQESQENNQQIQYSIGQKVTLPDGEEAVISNPMNAGGLIEVQRRYSDNVETFKPEELNQPTTNEVPLPETNDVIQTPDGVADALIIDQEEQLIYYLKEDGDTSSMTFDDYRQYNQPIANEVQNGETIVPQTETATQTQQATQYPQTKDGSIDFNSITDPGLFASGLNMEFASDSPQVLTELIAEAKQELADAENIKSVIDKRKAIKKANEKLAMYEQVNTILNPTAPVPEISTPVNTEGGAVSTEAPVANTEAKPLQDVTSTEVPAEKQSDVITFKLKKLNDFFKEGDAVINGKNGKLTRDTDGGWKFIHRTGGNMFADPNNTSDYLINKIYNTVFGDKYDSELAALEVAPLTNEASKTESIVSEDIQPTETNSPEIPDSSNNVAPQSSEGVSPAPIETGLIENAPLSEQIAFIEKNGKTINGITIVKISEDASKIEYGNNKSAVVITAKSVKDIADELQFNVEQLDYQQKQLPKQIDGNEKIQNSMGYTLQEKKDSQKGLNEAKKNIEILEKIVIPFYRIAQPVNNTASEKMTEPVSSSEVIAQAELEASTHPENNLPEPTDAQKEAGNYKMGHVTIQGLDISIENPKGSVRSGTDSDGEKWEITMNNTYGYIKGTVGRDKDHIDVFIGDNPESDMVFVVNQKDPKVNLFDEHKVMLGFNTIREAAEAYIMNYNPGWQGMMSIVPMQMDKFKEWVYDKNKTSKPAPKPKKTITPEEIEDEKREKAKRAYLLTLMPESFREAALQFFASGGRVRTSGFKKHFQKADMKPYIWAISDKSSGIYTDKLNEQELFSNFVSDSQRAENDLFDVLYELDGRNKAFYLLEKEINERWTEFDKELENASNFGYSDEEIKELERLEAEKIRLEEEEYWETYFNDIIINESDFVNIANLFYESIIAEENGKQQFTAETNKREVYPDNRGNSGQDSGSNREGQITSSKGVDGGSKTETNSFEKRLAEHDAKIKAAQQELKDAENEYAKSNKRVKKLGGQDQFGMFPGTGAQNNLFGGKDIIEQNKLNKEKVNTANERLNTLIKQRESIQPDNQLDVEKEGEKVQTEVFAGDVLNELTSPTSKENLQVEPKEEPKYGDKQARYDELKAKLKGKLNNLNAGIDPELFAIGVEMAAIKIEMGVKKFSQFAKEMVEELGDAIKPYLKSIYNGVRDLPEMEEIEPLMDEYNYVKKADIEKEIKKAIQIEKESSNFDNNLKPENNVSDRTGSSQRNSEDSPNEIPTDKGDVSNAGGRSGQSGNGVNKTSRKPNKPASSNSSGGLFADLFGEQSDNEVYQPEESSVSSQDDTGDTDGRGGSIFGSERQDDESNGGEGNQEVDGRANEKFSERTARKIEEQKKAEKIPVILNNEENIRQTLPLLLAEQQDDVIKAENRFFDKSHKTKELAYGKGILFTNGTGTGKTFTGLGIVKRFEKQGKKNILIVVPSEAKIKDWINDAVKINTTVTALQDTQDKGEGINITTYASFRANDNLKNRDFDLIIYDESHRLMEEKTGKSSATTAAHYQNSNTSEWQAYYRLTSIHPVWIEYKELNNSLKNLPTNASGDMMNIHVAELQERKEKIDKRLDELQELKNQLEPELRERAKKAYENTKVVFLSATPFKGHFNLRYANKVLFDWGEETTYTSASRGMSRVDAESQFFLDNFGSAYEWKFHRLQTKQKSNAEAIALQEVEFAQKLMQQGVMSGRAIESERDYSREYPLVALDRAEDMNKAFNDVFNYVTNEFQGLRDAAREVFYNYNYTTKLFESLKASLVIPRINKHLDLNRKVVIFHRRKQSGVTPPFDTIIRTTESAAKAILDDTNSSGEQKEEASLMLSQAEEFKQKYSDLLEYEKTLNYDSAIDQLLQAFGDKVVFVNGDTSKKDKVNNIKSFNDDNSNTKILVVQEEAGKEGISLHDVTGNHQRVLMSLSMPISSTTALQIEGRIFRIGQETDAIFEYPLLGLDMEIEAFGRTINKKLSTTENLAMGNQARDLLRSFAEGVLFHSKPDDPNTEQGKGGKEYDKKTQGTISEFQKAILVYSSNQKTRGKRYEREGIDYYATPEPVGQKMVEWLDIREGDSDLEPSAGHGAIAMWFPETSNVTAVEPSFKLYSKLNARSGGGNRKIVNDTFENLNVINKFNGIAMNPPFGTGGKMAMDHLEKAFHHLKSGGRIVALIPRGKMDERFDKFMYGTDEKGNIINSDASLVATVNLPSVTFQQAGTSVSARIVVIDKIKSLAEIRREIYDKDVQNVISYRGATLKPKEQVEEEAKQQYYEQTSNLYTTQYDLSDVKTVEELFDSIEFLTIPSRNIAKSESNVSQTPVNNDAKSTSKEGTVSYKEGRHTKTGEILHLGVINDRVEREEYDNISKIAKNLGGYYSKYAKGFVFDSKETADKFVNKVNTPEVSFRKVSQIGFYSTVENALDAIKQDKGTPEQFKAMLLKNGAKQAELDWMGWDEHFENMLGTITKADIQDFIDSNNIDVQEVVKGDYSNRNLEAVKVKPFIYNVVDTKTNEIVLHNVSQSRADEFIDNAHDGTNTKFSQYQEPGGENYKELLLTMPVEPKDNAIHRLDYLKTIGMTEDEYFNLPDEERNSIHRDFVKWSDAKLASNSDKRKNEFVSSHFDEPNILAHVRFKEYNTPNEKILFVEEFQSDWAQEGKKEGFRGTIKELPDNYGVSYMYDSVYIVDMNNPGGYISKGDTYEEAKLKALEALNNKPTIVPDMPFKQTDQWVKLALRRMIRYAAENGFDRIAWTNGEQQAARYDLSKQINEVEVEKGSAKKSWVYKLTFRDKNDNPFIDYANTPNELEALVGKELTNKIISDVVESHSYKSYTGVDLKVGGEGMKAFYDSIIPSTASKLIKPFGGKVETIKIDLMPNVTDSGIDTESGIVYDSVKGKYADVQSFPINQSLKETALGGLPLFNTSSGNKLPEEPTAQHVVDNIDLYEQHYQKITDSVREFAKNMKVTVKVVRTKLNLPLYIQKEISRMDDRQGRGRYPGVYDRNTKTIYIVAHDCKNTTEAQRTAAHEIIGHYGLRNLLGSEFAPTMELVYNGMTEAQRNDIMKKYGYNKDAHTDIADEFTARMAEGQEIPSWFAVIIAKIRNFIRKTFGFNLNMSEKDIVYLLWKSKNKLEEDATAGEVMDYIIKEDHVEKNAIKFQIIGEKGAEMIENHEQVMDNLRVAKEMEKQMKYVIKENDNPIIFYHGSPIKGIKSFDVLKAGSQNGELIYGKGIYFTEDKPYADQYRKNDGELYQAHISIEKPLIINEKDDISKYDLSEYDGVIVKGFNIRKNKTTIKEIVVFNSSNIRIIDPSIDVNQITPQQIRLATGWEKGVDGKWRYELPDANLKLSLNDINNLKSDNGINTNSLPLSDVLDNADLFKAYPDLKNVNVIFYEYGWRFRNSVPTAYFADDTNEIGIGVLSQIPSLRQVYTDNNLRKVYEQVGTDTNDIIKSLLLHEVQHIIQNIEGFETGTTGEKAWEFAVKEKMEKFKRSNLLYWLSEGQKKSIAEQDLLDENKTNRRSDAAHSLYIRSAGEVEARNTQSRRNISEEQRRNTLLADTEDVSRDQQIILREGGGMAMSVSDLPETITINGVERPTTNSNGKPIATTEQGIRNFYEWFGDSKVVDEQGKPLVVYHGTVLDKGQEPFKEFNIREFGFHFGNIEQANKRANKFSMINSFDTNTVPYMYEVYLKIENPIYSFSDTRDWDDNNELERVLHKSGSLENSEAASIGWNMDSDYIRQELLDLGYDGVKYKNTYEGKGDSYIVFSNDQIKSATGNNGDFDPNDPNINFKREDDTPPEGSTKRYIDSMAKGFTQGIQNKDLPLKLMEEDLVKDSGIKLDESNSAYMWSDKYKSGAGKQMQSFERNQIKPLIESIKEITDKTGKDIKAVSDYLLAKHSIERHEAGEVSALSEDPNADWNMEKATAIVDTFENSVPKPMVDDLWDKVRKATRFSLDYSFSSGFMDLDTYDKLSSQYQFYVPLRGWDFTEKINPLEYYNFATEQKNGSTFQNPLIKAKGRTSKPADPLPHIVAMGESAIIYGMKNQFKLRLLALARQHQDRKDVFNLRRAWEVLNPLTGEWTETYDPPQDLIDERKKIYEEIKKLEKSKKNKTVDKVVKIDEQISLLKENIKIRNTRNRKNEMYLPKSSADQRVVNVWERGIKYELSLTDPEVANVVNGIDNKVWWLMGNERANKQWYANFNRWLSANFTSKNPAFIAPNMVRDLMFATTSHWIQDDGTLLEFYKNMPKAASAIHRYIRETEDMNNESDKELKTFFEFGGATGYTQLKDLQKIAKDIEEDIFGKKGFRKVSGDAQLYTGLHHLGKLMDYTAMQSEMISRFATYLAAKKVGKTTFEAIDMAKNITVNFDRKGEWSGILGALYAFFNPSVQGVNVASKLYKKNKLRFIAACLMPVMFGFVNSFLLSLTKGDDDDYPTDFELSNNIMFRTGEGYVKIPLPPFFRAFWGMGAQLHRAMVSGETETKDAVFNIMDGIVNATSPINIMSGTKELQRGKAPLRPLVPTWLVAPYDLWVNEDFKGDPVFRKLFTTELEKYTPNSEKGFKGTNKFLQDATKNFNKLGGGNEFLPAGTDPTGLTKSNSFKKFIFDWNPAIIEHVIEYYTGGRGKFVNDITKTVVAAANKEIEFNSYNIPIANRFYSTSNAKKDIASDYYGIKDRLNTYEHYLSQAKSAIKSGEPEKQVVPFVEMISETDMLILNEKDEFVSKRIKMINEKLDSNPSAAEIKELRLKKQELMKEFIEEFNSKIEKGD